MIDKSEIVAPRTIVQATVKKPYSLPFFSSLVHRGFASLTKSYLERRLDLNELYNVDSKGIYFVRAMGESLIRDRIYPDDVLVVNAICKPCDGIL